MTKALTATLILALLAVPTAAPGNPVREPQVNTIVIDPGHGGRDRGAVGSGGLEECEVTLAIALRLKALIEADPVMRAGGVRVVLVRDDDTLPTLEDRAATANSADGDLYISIHVNGHEVRSAYGAETYILSLKASDEHAQKVAEFENEAIEEALHAPEGEEDDLKLILFDVIQKKFIEESMYVAELIQSEFNSSLNLRDRGVRQAPFRVLKGVAMPAVLVEVDYISNPRREQLLRTESYRTELAQSLLNAIKAYKRIKERGAASSAAGQDSHR